MQEWHREKAWRHRRITLLVDLVQTLEFVNDFRHIWAVVRVLSPHAFDKVNDLRAPESTQAMNARANTRVSK